MSFKEKEIDENKPVVGDTDYDDDAEFAAYKKYLGKR